MRNIILIGPPGSGKDTQIDALKEYMDFEMISAGDIARDLASRDEELAAIIKDGGLIDDNLVLSEIDSALNNIPSEKGVVFDGFPRTIYQAEKLNVILISHNRTLDAAVYLELGEREIVKRLSGRMVCSKCGQPFSNNEKSCSRCGGSPVKRPDDEPTSIIKRIQTFLDKTMPIVSYYKDRGILIEIEGDQKVEKVTEDIVRKLDLCKKPIS